MQLSVLIYVKRDAKANHYKPKAMKRKEFQSPLNRPATKRLLVPFLVLLAPLLFLPLLLDAGSAIALTNDIGLRTVVIDAGHGGKDPGCHGHSTHEKDVCLSIALALGDYIEENYPDVKVIYTRKTDVFIELHERAAIANRNNADLFICIHANAGQSGAHGAETYIMGLHKNEANLKVAQRENSAILMEDNYEQNYQDFDGSPASIIAISMQQAAYLEQSANFASKIQSQFTSLGRRDRGVKQAGFLVLYRTTMPSVLIETGFLTNDDEEKWLADKANHKKLANGIYKAFQDYKKDIESVNSIMGDDDGEAPEQPTPTPVVTNDTEDNNDEPDAPDVPETNETGIALKVQIATSTKPLDKKSPEFKGLKNVDEYISSGLYKYTVGKEATLQDAKSLQTELRAKGFNGAFIVAFKEGRRIDLQRAIDATNQ